jgi:hypothetical protein
MPVDFVLAFKSFLLPYSCLIFAPQSSYMIVRYLWRLAIESGSSAFGTGTREYCAFKWRVTFHLYSTSNTTISHHYLVPSDQYTGARCPRIVGTIAHLLHPTSSTATRVLDGDTRNLAWDRLWPLPWLKEEQTVFLTFGYLQICPY